MSTEGDDVSASFPEREVIRVWQNQLLDRNGLMTEGGEPIEVIYPGRVNSGRGADFCDAVIGTSQGLVKGDIEVHVKSSSWREHGHHRDAAYNRVILHVVMWQDRGAVTNLQNGGEVPILALNKYVRSPVSQGPGLLSSADSAHMPCFEAARCLTAGAVAEFLDGAGEERFWVKTAAFQMDLVQMEASQSFYQGIMGALGYSRNKLPFLELARRLPLHILESMAREDVSDEDYLARQQALLLGTAGLLPSQHRDGCLGTGSDGLWIDRLESLWVSASHDDVMPLKAWHLFRVRPNNSPLCRLMAMSYLLVRYREEGLLNGLAALVKEAPVSRGCNRLEKGLLVVDDGCRQRRFDSVPGTRLGSRTLLGPERALEIIVNVLLPFVFAWSRFTSQPELAEKALDLYRQCPKPLINSIERHMLGQFGLRGRLVNSAQRQQGLIHIYNTLCTEGRCRDCGLSQLEAGKHV